MNTGRPGYWPPSFSFNLNDSLPMPLLIIGHGECGKDTAADMICRKTGLKSLPSSFVMRYVVFERMPRSMRERYGNADVAYLDRRKHRKLWFDAIAEWTADDRSKLVRTVLQHADIYTGLRQRDEFEESKDLFDLIIWIDRDICKVEDGESNQLNKNDADVIIPNNDTLEELDRKIDRLVHFGDLHI